MINYSGNPIMHVFKRLIPACLLALLLVMLPVPAPAESQTSINFNTKTISGINGLINNPTSLQFGPDNRLYVSQQNGTVWAFTIERDNTTGTYSVVDVEQISIIQGIQNHNDDGSYFNNNVRQVTALVVTGTATNPVLYVGSSDNRIGGGADKGDVNLDTNSGVISRLTWIGTDLNDPAGYWDHVQVLRGLPRSEENHANNGMMLVDDGLKRTLYVASGGLTNAGAPSNNFAFITEYALSAAILEVDLDMIEAMPLNEATINGRFTRWLYDLPTLDDPTRPNLPDGSDPDDPFGGNDGLNQAKVVPGSPVQVYSPGYRNSYDVVVTQDGRMYTVDNGPNGGWGGYPVDEGPAGNCTNEYDPNEPGFVNNKDNLHFVPFQGFYAGHPAPVRGNPAGAGLYTDNDAGNQVFRSQILPESDPNFATQSLPVDWPPYPTSAADPAECDYRQPGVDDGALATFNASTNGIIEYTATAPFGGALAGDLLMASFDGLIYRATLSPDGTAATISTFASNFGAVPLDVTAQGDDDIFPGTVWAATYGADDVVVFEPADYFVCEGTYDNTIDEDNDGYTNADEIDNGTDPCLSAERPPDNDRADGPESNGFYLSDLNDPDDDNDGLLDTYDVYAIDRFNGQGLTVPFDMPLLNGDPNYGFFGLGLTGLMTNGTPAAPGDDYLTLYDDTPATFIAGGAVGLFSMPISAGTAEGTTNTDYQNFHLGINTGSMTLPFTVATQINGAFFDNSPQPGQEQGLYIGTGTQSDYLKIVYAIASDNSDVIRVVQEENDVVLFDQSFPTGGILSSTSIQLYLTIDPNTGVVQPAYASNNGTIFTPGSTVTLSGNSLAALNGTYTVNGLNSAMAAGFTATSGASGVSFGATWDWLRADYAEISEVGTWELLNSESAGAPNDRHENGYVNAGGLFYLIGGRGTRDVDIYNPRTDTWVSTGVTPPVEMHHTQPVVLDGLIYVVNGYTGQCCSSEFGLDHVYIFNPVTTGWYQGMEIPETRRRGSTGVVVYNNKIYTVGGLDGGHGTSATSYAYFDVYDPYANTWSTLPDAPRARDHFNAVVVNDKLYLAGGRQTDVQNFFDNTLGPVDVFDFNTNTWSTLPAGSNIPTQRAGTMATRIGNEVVVIGGEGNGNAYSVTEALNVNNLTWRSLNVLNQQRHGTGVAVCNDTLYVAAGSGAQGDSPEINTQERYSLYGATTCPETPFTPGTFGATPSPVDFGDVISGENATQTITISNSGGDQGMLIQSLALTDGTSYSLLVTDTLPLMLAPGSSMTFDVTFAPLSDGTLTDSITVETSVGTQTINLTGNGQVLSAPTLRVNAGGPEVADTPISWTINTAGSPTYSTGGAISTSGALATNNTDAPDAIFTHERYAPHTWAFPGLPNGEYRVTFYFMEGYGPAMVDDGRVFDINVEGVLAFDDYDIYEAAGFAGNVAIMETYDVTVSDGTLNIEFINNIQEASIRGIQIAPVNISTTNGFLVTQDDSGVAMDTVYFFNTPQGDTSAPQTLVLLNSGSADLNISSIAVDPASTDPAAFAVAPTDPVILAPGASISLAVTFTPTKLGLHDADLLIDHDGDNGPTTLVNLQGEGGPGTEPPEGEVLFRVNVGGPQLAAADGSLPDWSIDSNNGGSASPYRVGGGQNFYNGGEGTAHPGPIIMTHPSLTTAPAAPALLFNTERWDPAADPVFAWAFPVQSGGTYTLRLYFAELYGTVDTAGERLIDVTVEGTLVFDDLDQIVTAGEKGAFVEAHTLTMTDDTLNFELTHVADNPALKGIEVIAVNRAPVVDPIADETTGLNSSLTVDVTASDADSDPITLSATMTDAGGATILLDGSAWAQFTDNGDGTGQFLFENATAADVGAYDIVVTATDDSSAQGSEAFVLTVAEQTITITDPVDGAKLPGPDVTVTWETQNGLTDDHVHVTLNDDPYIGGQTLNGSYTFAGLTPGPHTIKVELADSIHVLYPGVVDTITIEIQGPPVLDAIPAQTMSAGGVLSVPITATDPNPSDTLVLSATMTDSGGAVIPTDGSLWAELVDNGDGTGNLIFTNPAIADLDTYDLTVTVEDGTDTASTPFTLTVTDEPPSAYVSVNLGGGIGASTYTAGSIIIENTSVSLSHEIVGVTFDLRTAMLSDMVFDPVGTAGDTVGKCLTPDAGDAATGYIIPAGGNCALSATNGATLPFSGLNDGGYDLMGMTFSDFQTGESFSFSVDIDPLSIQGAGGTGSAGAVSGLELIGTTVTIEFSDGTLYATELYTVPGPSAGGSQTVTAATVPADALTIAVQGVTLDGDSAAVIDPAQTIDIVGPAGATVSLTQIDTRLLLDDTPQCGFDVQPYESNEAMAVVEYTPIQLDASGVASVPVTLLETAGDPSGGLNYFTAAIVDSSTPRQNGVTSNHVILSYPAPPNQAPRWITTPLSPQTMAEGDTLSLPFTACDIEADSTVAFSATMVDGGGTAVLTDGSAWISVTDNADNSGSIAFTPGFLDAGMYTVTLIVTDVEGLFAEYVFTLEVTDVNAPPEIDAVTPDPQVMNEAETLSLPITATDVDGDAVTLTLVSVTNNADNTAATFAAFTADATPVAGQGSGTLEFTPGFLDAGTYTVTLSADDGINTPLTEYVFTLEVTDVNAPPEIDAVTPDPQVMNEAETLSLPITATDVDGDAVTLTLVSVLNNADTTAAAFASFAVDATPVTDKQGSGTIEFTPQVGDAGTYTVMFSADDGINTPLTEYSFTLEVNPVNAPVIDPVDPQIMAELETLSVPVSATDADTASITLDVTAVTNNADSSAATFYTYTADAPGVGSASGTIEFTPGITDAGTYTVELTADDGITEPVTLTFELTVTDAAAPVIAPVVTQTVAELETLSVPVSATDADTETITLAVTAFTNNADNSAATFYTYTADAPGVGSASGTIEFTPGVDDAGVYTVELTADDGDNPPVTLTFELTVTDAAAPAVDPVAPQTVAELETLSVPVSATDIDTAEITLDVTAVTNNADNSAATFYTYTADAPGVGTASGTIEFTPGVADAGTYTVELTADDGDNPPVTLTFELTVTDAAAPVIDPVDSADSRRTGYASGSGERNRHRYRDHHAGGDSVHEQRRQQRRDILHIHSRCAGCRKCQRHD